MTDLMLEMSDPISATASRPQSAAVLPRSLEGNPMLLHEALARARMRELESVARECELVRSVTAGRRWEQLARFADERARLARRRAVRPRP